jgi:hypothetical protein
MSTLCLALSPKGLINKFQEINVAILNNSQVPKKASRTLGTIDKCYFKILKNSKNSQFYQNLYLTRPSTTTLVEAKNDDKQF